MESFSDNIQTKIHYVFGLSSARFQESGPEEGKLSPQLPLDFSARGSESVESVYSSAEPFREIKAVCTFFPTY